ncbi:MAG: hypothetical protein KKH61_06965 [Gammaproteobacteria bacterium]|uniref:Type 1 fimbria pilin n=1 Tax=Stenotrophomonas rhizophila TaxID=216778 RepID=A0AAW5PHG0_9GAMM|nr:hypothetical protein [Stenotrophomonas rhizophila]MBU2048703.1 hypothetical protein [Gammaproteobacteria bacterium]MCS4280142.1 type 1 fimbria pilin [Stenotrophomonas rhizophila]
MTRKALTAAALAIAALVASQASHAQALGFGAGGEFYVPTCGFTAVDVDLLRHDADRFTGVGSATPWQYFTLGSTGCSASVTAVNLTFRGVADPDNTNLHAFPGIPGVGVDITSWDNEEAGPNGVTKAWAPRPTGEGYLYRARLMQTLPSITPGTGRAAITVDVSYN